MIRSKASMSPPRALSTHTCSSASAVDSGAPPSRWAASARSVTPSSRSSRSSFCVYNAPPTRLVTGAYCRRVRLVRGEPESTVEDESCGLPTCRASERRALMHALPLGGRRVQSHGDCLIQWSGVAFEICCFPGRRFKKRSHRGQVRRELRKAGEWHLALSCHRAAKLVEHPFGGSPQPRGPLDLAAWGSRGGDALQCAGETLLVPNCQGAAQPFLESMDCLVAVVLLQE